MQNANFLDYINLDGLLFTFIAVLASPVFILLIVSLLLFVNNKKRPARICLIISVIYLLICFVIWGMMMT